MAEPTISLDIQRDALGISELLRDQQEEKERLQAVIAGIRKALGDDARDVLLLDLPAYVASRLPSPPAVKETPAE